MYLVDRSVASIRPKQAFLNWLQSQPDWDVALTLEQLRVDCHIFLLPEFNEPEEAIAYIDECYMQIFQMELASWYADSAVWPADQSLKAFWEWFDIEVHSTVFDTVDEALRNAPVEGGLLN